MLQFQNEADVLKYWWIKCWQRVYKRVCEYLKVIWTWNTLCSSGYVTGSQITDIWFHLVSLVVNTMVFEKHCSFWYTSLYIYRCKWNYDFVYRHGHVLCVIVSLRRTSQRKLNVENGRLRSERWWLLGYNVSTTVYVSAPFRDE